MADIKWTAPPPKHGNADRGSHHDFVKALKSRPGEWAMYHPDRGHNSGTAAHLKRVFPGVEATARTRPDGKYDIYARYVGNGSEPS